MAIVALRRLRAWKHSWRSRPVGDAVRRKRVTAFTQTQSRGLTASWAPAGESFVAFAIASYGRARTRMRSPGSANQSWKPDHSAEPGSTHADWPSASLFGWVRLFWSDRVGRVI